MSNFTMKIERLIRCVIGKDFFVKEDYICNSKKFGSQYGGWNIVDSEIDRNSIIYSFGVGEDASFDIELIKSIDVTIHAFDPTPRSIKWVKEQKLPELFVLHKYGIADFDGIVRFNPPVNPKHVSHTILERAETSAQAIEVPMKKLKTIMEELGHIKIDLLKMDIEGAEYSVLKNLELSDVRPKQLLIEFHHRFQNVGIEKTKAAIRDIKKMGYGLFFVSSSGEEYSFIYKNGLQKHSIRK